MSDAVSVPLPTKVVTEYYFSRWVSLAFSLLLSSASGSGYAFGIWSSVLKGPPLNLSADDVSLNASLSNMGLYLGVVNGLLYGRVGPRITILIGVLLVCLGFICNYLLLSGIGFPASLPLLCFFSFVAQFGSSFLQTSAVSTAVRNFPALSRGQIGGLVKGTFALASSMLGEYYLALFSGNPLNYLLFVAIYVPLMALSCMPFINIIPRETVEHYQEENERSQITLHARLFDQAAVADGAKETDKNAKEKGNLDADVIPPASGKLLEGAGGAADEEKSESWKTLAGSGALNVELATLSRTVTMANSSTPTYGRAVLLARAGSEGTVSPKFNDSAQDEMKSPKSAVKSVTLKVPTRRRRRPLNAVFHLLAKLSPSGPLHPQSMLYGYLFLAFTIGIYVSTLAAVQAKVAVSQGLRIGGFVLTDLLLVSFIVIGASFGDFRIKFQRTVPATYEQPRFHWLWSGAKSGHGHGHGHAHGADESKNLWQALHTVNFYLLQFAQFCLAGTGLMLINNMSDIAKAYAANDSTSVSNDPSLLVVIVGFGSFGGRVFCGFVSDRTIRYISRPMYHSLASLLLAFCMALLAGSLNYNALYPVSLMAGFAYGVAFSTTTTMVADLFGPTHHAAIYGAVDLGPCAGSVFIAYYIKNRFYTGGTNVPAAQLKTLSNYCFGYTCFQNTFIICCCASLLASTLTFIVSRRTKEVYKTLLERVENMQRTENEKKMRHNEMLKQQLELEQEDAQKRQKLAEERAQMDTAASNRNEKLSSTDIVEAPAAALAISAVAVPRVSLSLSVSGVAGDAEAEEGRVVRFHVLHAEDPLHAAAAGTKEENY